MVQLKLPVQKDVLNEKNELIKGEEEITVYVDTSFASHMRWQQYFQEEYNNENLAVQISKASLWLKNEDLAMAHLLDLFKIMYCFIKSNDLPDFNTFISMMDNKSAPILLEKMTIILNEAGNSATKKLKARADYLIKLVKLLGQYKESKDQHVPSILDWVRSAIDAGLDSTLMNQLNFTDLQAMVIEYRIREKEAEIERSNKEKRTRSGNSFRQATPEDIDRL